MIIVTAGHIDHGKTALIEALTGTNADRLPEEKKRGMTIDLGYAYLPLAEHTLGFIDVPGHKKFLANMLAGLGGVENAMLIIAADEGIKPQTIEHLEILSLLALKNIIVVISKSDRVNSAQITALSAQIIQQFPILQHSPQFITSALSGEGIPQLRTYLSQLSNQALINKPFRYAIDRIFSIKGVGTVVTGTAFSGQVAVDAVVMYGRDKHSLSDNPLIKVKNIHAQNQTTSVGLAGQRLALNINVDKVKSEIKRGDWLFSQTAFSTERITVKLTAAQNLVENQTVHLYFAASYCTARLNLLDAKKANRGEQNLAEIILEQPLYLCYADKLIIRSADKKQTLAGAYVLEIDSAKRYKRSEERLTYLHHLQQCKNYAERIALYLSKSAVNIDKILWIEQLLLVDIENLVESGQILRHKAWLYLLEYQLNYQQKIISTLETFHQQNPDQLGVSRARLLRMAAVNQPEKLMYFFIDELIAQQKLYQTNGWLHLPQHQLMFSEMEQHYWQQIKPLFLQTDQPNWVRDIANLIGLEENTTRSLLYKAGKLGYLTPIVKDRFYLSEDINKLAHLVRQHIQREGSISVNQLRDELGYGRKLTVQLVEYFNRIGFLRRKGNIHLLRDEGVFDNNSEQEG